jgi:hypothetical protein
MARLGAPRVGRPGDELLTVSISIRLLSVRTAIYDFDILSKRLTRWNVSTRGHTAKLV